MLLDKLKNLPKDQSLKDAQEENPELSSEVESFLAGLSAASLEGLSAVQNTASADLLQLIDAGEFPKDLKKGARKALHLLGTKGIKPAGAVMLKKESTLPRPDFKEAYASEVDAGGNQLLLGVFSDPLGSLSSAYLLGDESLGFKEIKMTPSSRKMLQTYIQHYEEHHVHLTALGLEEFRWLVYRYQLITEALHQPLPPAYARIQKLLGENVKVTPSCPLYEKFSSPQEAADYLGKVDQLLTKGEASWWLPQDQLKPWKQKYAEAQKGVLVLNEMLKKEQLQEIEDQARRDLITEAFSGKIKGRLEAWACLLWAQKKEDKAKGVLAAARALEQDPLGQANPLIRSMVKSALEGVTAALCDHEHKPKEGKGPESSLLWVPGKRQ